MDAFAGPFTQKHGRGPTFDSRDLHDAKSANRKVPSTTSSSMRWAWQARASEDSAITREGA